MVSLANSYSTNGGIYVRVAIITFVRAYNYGAVLQAYALNKIINKLGVECKVIDYFSSGFKKYYSLSEYGSFRLKPSRKLKWWISNNLLFLRVAKRNNNFSNFLTKNINLTDTQFNTYNDLMDCEDFDIYISGSDQVWNSNICGFDRAYYLSFCENKKRFSYAASFGMDQIPNETVSKYKELLANWGKYSVREQSGIKIIKDLVGEKAVCCCDPTILLSTQDWMTIGKQQKAKKFILLYFVNESKYLFEYARQLSVEKNIAVVCLHSNMHPKYFTHYLSREFGFVSVPTASPTDFIQYFRDATYVLTNSFHGTVFSVIFHKKFLCQHILDDGKYNNRIFDFLEDIGLSNRFLKESSFETIEESINWKEVDISLEIIRKTGMDYLASIIS